MRKASSACRPRASLRGRRGSGICRDAYIDWRPGQRSVNLASVVNNARFLILPWVHSPNLASRIFGGTLKRLPEDWRQHYGYRPVLLETFMLKGRFREIICSKTSV